MKVESLKYWLLLGSIVIVLVNSDSSSYGNDYDVRELEDKVNIMGSLYKRSAYGLMGLVSSRPLGHHKTRAQLKFNPPESFISVKGRKRSLFSRHSFEAQPHRWSDMQRRRCVTVVLK